MRYDTMKVSVLDTFYTQGREGVGREGFGEMVGLMGAYCCLTAGQVDDVWRELVGEGTEKGRDGGQERLIGRETVAEVFDVLFEVQMAGEEAGSFRRDKEGAELVREGLVGLVDAVFADRGEAGLEECLLALQDIQGLGDSTGEGLEKSGGNRSNKGVMARKEIERMIKRYSEDDQITKSGLCNIILGLEEENQNYPQLSRRES